MSKQQPEYGNISFDARTHEIHVIHPNAWLVPGYTEAHQTLLTIQSWMEGSEPQLQFEKPSNPVFQPPEYLSTNCCTDCSSFNDNCGQVCLTFYNISGDFTCNCIVPYNHIPIGTSGGGNRSCSRKDKGQLGTARDTIENALGHLPPQPFETGGRVDCTDLSHFIWAEIGDAENNYCVRLEVNTKKTVYIGHTHAYFDPGKSESDGLDRACCNQLGEDRCQSIVSANERQQLNNENKECSNADKDAGRTYPLIFRAPLKTPLNWL